MKTGRLSLGICLTLGAVAGCGASDDVGNKDASSGGPAAGGAAGIGEGGRGAGGYGGVSAQSEGGPGGGMDSARDASGGSKPVDGSGFVDVATDRLTTDAGSGPTHPNDWLQFGRDSAHSGNNTDESVLTAANVKDLKSLARISLPGAADGAPAYLSDVLVKGVKTDLLFITTKDGHIVAIDASTSMIAWQHQYGPGSCKINNGADTCYTTSSPVVDPSRQFVYSYGLDGLVHKFQADTGDEITADGWPEVVTTKAFDEKGSSALAFASSNGKTFLYAANGGYPGDNGDYQGHITAINLSTGAQSVFNTVCSDQAVHFKYTPATPDCPEQQTAIWSRGAVMFDSSLQRIFMTTGNGTFAPSKHHWGDTVFALHPDGTGVAGDPIDTYTPTNFQDLQNSDTDIGSTGPALLPVPSTSSVKHLAVQGGKDSKLRLINLEDLSGTQGIGKTGGEIDVIDVPQGGLVFGQPAVWVNPSDKTTWVFVPTPNGISGLQLAIGAGGKPSLKAKWKNSAPSTSPIVANGVLFVAGPQRVRAFDPTTGTQLWSDTQLGDIHWASPIVARGALFVASLDNHMNVYTLGGANIAIP